MITTRYIDVAFGGARSAMARALYQYDYGQILRITDLALPFAYEVHFSDTKTGNSVTMIGNADGVEIPDACLLTSGNVYCWFYLHDTESDGETRYEVLIPILSRAKPTNAAPTPVQQDVIDQAIAALDAAVQQTGEDVIAAGASASAAAGSASDAEAWAVGERDGEPVESSDPTYHNNSKYYAGEAASAAQTASQDAQTASDAAIAAGNAKTAAETAQGKAETAQEKAEAAQTAAEGAADQTALDVIAAADSADEASGYANTASGYASTASGYAIAAQGHAQDASGYASSASGYATNAYNSATAAAGSAGEASGYASTASGYASAANDAKLAAQGAQTSAETAQGLAEAAQTGAEAAQTAAETARDAAIAATEDKAPVILDSASGAIASISDGAGGMNARSLVASMSPIQDLHGQAAPYPAGGGKNLYNSATFPSATIGDVTCTNNGDGSFTLNGTASANVFFNIFQNQFSTNAGGTPLPSAEYRLTGVPSGAGSSDFYLYTTPSYGGDRGEGQTFTNTITGGSIYIKSGTHINNVTIWPMIRLASNGDDTFAPYSNICPISGRTGVTVTRTGKNLLDESTRTVYGDGKGLRWSQADGFTLKAGQTYTFTVSGSSQLIRLYIIDNVTITSIIDGNTSITYTPTTDRRVHFQAYRGTAIEDSNVFMLNLGSTALPYEPYTGASFPVTWTDDAGTVYGGTVDVVSGLLTVTHEIVDLGALSWVISSTNDPNKNRFMANLDEAVQNNSASAIPDCVCSQYPIVSANNTYLLKMGLTIYKGGNVHNCVYIYDPQYDTVAADVFAMAMSGVQLVYELATPQTYQLTPTQVQMLLGVNNIWSTGDTVDLSYPCDTRLYIERLTEPTEDDMTANANIASGKYFMVGNALYYSTAAITAGQSIVVGSNCNRVSLADALNALN